jgi:hypothetical protein
MLDSKISNVQNTSDVVCNWLIELLSHTCKYYGISYGELNMLLCTIVGLLILGYFTSSIFLYKNAILGIRLSKIMMWVTIVVTISIIIFIGIVPLPDSMF